MLAFLKIIRPVNGLMAIFAVLVSAFIVNYPIDNNLFIAVAAVFLITSGGMVINDYFDYEIDKINQPDRPIPSGKISKNVALLYSLLLFLTGNILLLNLGFLLITLAVVNTILLILYSWRLKKIVLVGNLSVAWLSASSFIFGGLLKGVLTVNTLILFMMLFFISVGREIVKTIEDVKGDKKYDAKTLPVIFGEKFSGWLAVIFIFFGILLSPIPYALGLMNVNYVVVVAIADIVFAVSAFILFISPRKSQQTIKLGMVLGLVSFFVGII